MTCCDEARRQARKQSRHHRFASQKPQQRLMTAWKPDQSESDLRAPAKTPFPSFDAVYLRFRAAPRSAHLSFRATLFLPVCASAPKHRVACKLAPDTAANPVQISAHPIRTVDFQQRAACLTPFPPSPIHNSGHGDGHGNGRGTEPWTHTLAPLSPASKWW